MKKIDNYKNIRRKASIMGLSTTYFIIFFALSSVSVMVLIGGISLIKVICIAAFIGLSYGTCYVLNRNDISQMFMSNKFPKEVSNLTEDEY